MDKGELEIKEIPDTDDLFYAIHIDNFKTIELFVKETIPYNAFQSKNGSISTNWSGIDRDGKFLKNYQEEKKYRQSVENIKKGKNPNDCYKSKNCYKIVILPVNGVRHDAGCKVTHAPLKDNLAHTDVHGLEGLKNPKKTTLRKKLAKLADWHI